MLSCCGLNYKTAPIELREKVSVSGQYLESTLKEFCKETKTDHAVILSTCNRTEIYSVNQPKNSILGFLSEYHQIKSQELSSHLYHHQHENALRHILRVATGLDSMMIGETQILWQLRSAVNIADKSGTLGSNLRRVFDQTLSSAKKIRTETNIQHYTPSFGMIINQLAKTIFDKVGDCRVLFIGAGEIIENVFEALKFVEVSEFWLANRSISKAEKISGVSKEKTISLQEISQILPKVDIVISGIHHLTPIVGKGVVETAIKLRKHKPILMVDLGIPRNIEPEIKKLDDVYLYHIDDLNILIQEKIDKKNKTLLSVEQMIEKQIDKILQNIHQLKSVNTVKKYREKMYSIRDEVLQSSLDELKAGHLPEEVIKKLSHQLTNKLIHEPCLWLKK